MPYAKLTVRACVYMAMAIALNAIAAHYLRQQLDAKHLQLWHTASQYWLWGASALLAIANINSLCQRCKRHIVIIEGGLWIFSLSLMALSLGAPNWIGAITPLGGVSMIVGSLALAYQLQRNTAANLPNTKTSDFT